MDTFVCAWQYDYDALDRMTAVRAKATAEAAFTLVARYGYDVLGQRIARRVYATTCAPAPAPTVEYVRYAVWEGQVQFETDSVGTTVGRQYFWGPGTDDLRAATDPSDGKRYFAITDKLGSVRAWVSQAGVRGGGWRYSPYGTTLTVSGGVGTHFPYRWTGREYDGETGFYFNRARYYDPKQGRFTQEDPIGLAGGRNLYAYVDGQPLEARDPSGLLAAYETYIPNTDQMSFRDMILGLQAQADGMAALGYALMADLEQRGQQSNFRAMTADERAKLASLCMAIDCTQVRIHTNDPETDRMSGRTTGSNDIYLGDMTGLGAEAQVAKLAHELTHLNQRHEMGAVRYRLAQWGAGDGGPVPVIPGRTTWGSLNIEQQGYMVEACYNGSADACSISPYQFPGSH